MMSSRVRLGSNASARCGAAQRKRAALHSMTSSARARSAGRGAL